MRKTMMKRATFAALGLLLTLVSACGDIEAEERAKKASLEAMNCSSLSTQAAVTREKIKALTEKATISAVASAFTKGTKSDLNSINSSLSQIMRKDLEKELTEIQILMARKGCR